MKREFLKGFEGLTEEMIDKIMAEAGKGIEAEKAKTNALRAENDTLKADKEQLETRISEMTDKASTTEDYKSQLEALRAELQEKEEKERLEAEDRELTTAIMEAIGNKNFSSDYAKEGVIRDMKNLIAQKENKGKSYVELFEALTKDKDGIFQNPNPPADMKGMGSGDFDTNDDAARAVMGLPPLK